MTPAAHIHSALTASLAHHLAGRYATSAACVLLAAVPVMAGQIGLEGVQAVAQQWLSTITKNVILSSHASPSLKAPPRTR